MAVHLEALSMPQTLGNLGDNSAGCSYKKDAKRTDETPQKRSGKKRRL
jgi:hypothetical protein